MTNKKNGRRRTAGRPRIDCTRTASGRPSRAGKGPVPPNVKVQEARAAFRWFHGDKVDQQIHDPIGRAWAVGLLEGYGFDAKVLRDKGREYGDRYWTHYSSTAPLVGRLEGSSGGGRSAGRHNGPILPDPTGLTFAALDGAVTLAGAAVRDAVHDLCIDQYWFPETSPPWLDRLITERRVAEWQRRTNLGQVVGPPIAGAFPVAGDREKLKQAVLGLSALASGTQRPRRDGGPSLAELTRPPEFDDPAETPAPPAVDPAFLDAGGRLRPWNEIADIIRERFAANDPNPEADVA